MNDSRVAQQVEGAPIRGACRPSSKRVFFHLALISTRT